MKKDITDMTLEELKSERDRLSNDMFLAGSPALSSASGNCSPCDWGYGDKIKAINEQIDIARKNKTMASKDSMSDHEK